MLASSITEAPQIGALSIILVFPWQSPCARQYTGTHLAHAVAGVAAVERTLGRAKVAVAAGKAEGRLATSAPAKGLREDDSAVRAGRGCWYLLWWPFHHVHATRSHPVPS